MPVSRREVGAGLGAAAVMAAAGGARAASDKITVYVGTYTVPKGKAAGIVTLSMDRATGVMTKVAETPARNPSFLAVNKDRTRLYASNEVRDFEGQWSGYVTAYEIAPDGGLKELNKQPSNGVSPAHCALDRTGKFLIAANFISGHFSVLPLDADGRILPSTDRMVRTGAGPHFGRQLGPNGHCTAVHPTNGDIACIDLGADGVDIRTITPDGKLKSKNQSMAVIPGSGPRHATYSQDGAFLYVNHEIHNSVSIYRTASGPGEVNPLAVVGSLPPDYRSASAANSESAVDPTGRFLVVSNRGPNTFAVYAIDQKTGLLSDPRYYPVEGEGPRHFGFTPDGTMIVVSNLEGDCVVSFRFDPATGAITTLSKLPLLSPACAVFV